MDEGEKAGELGQLDPNQGPKSSYEPKEPLKKGGGLLYS